MVCSIETQLYEEIRIHEEQQNNGLYWFSYVYIGYCNVQSQPENSSGMSGIATQGISIGGEEYLKQLQHRKK